MTFHIRSYKNLPATDVGWLTLKDHFIATVGPYSGQGRPLKNLLVLADAKLKPQTSFPQHPHQDMEILTWVVEGTLHHQDNKASEQYVPAANLQLMSARDGIYHAEGNSSDSPLRILQIWIKPNTSGGTPAVLQVEHSKSGFQLLAGPQDAPLILRQDFWFYAALIQEQEAFEIPAGKFGYALFIGKLKLNETPLDDGDGVELSAGKYTVQGSGQTILMLQNL